LLTGGVVTATPSTSNASARLLRGVCLSPARNPLSGVEVTAVVGKGADLAMQKEYRRTITDASGLFAIPWHTGEQIELLRAERDGYAPAELTQTDFPTTRSVELILEPLASCEVQVFKNRPDGGLDRVSGTATFYVLRRVAAENETQNPHEATQLAGRFVTIGAEQVQVENGRHILQGYPQGVYKIAVVAENDYAESEPFSLGRAGQVVATVVLGNRQHFEGVVLSKSTQQPIPKAEISLVPQKLPHPDLARTLALKTTSDGDGRFVFDKVVPSVYVLTISADGYTTHVVNELLIPTASDSSSLQQVYYLEQGSPTLRILVRDSGGKPLQGAKIALYAQDPSAIAPTHFAEADQNGQALLSNLTPGRYTAIVSLADAPQRQKQQEVLVPERGEATITVTFAPLVEVRGTVRLTTGEPWNGLIYFVPRGLLGPKTFAKADASGGFQAMLEPGEYVVGRADQPATSQLRVYREGNTGVVVTLR
ncbi:MAG: carboxypeptidase-like regulatory domain-containing protein, partial [Candidatus Sumerlaeaceae bacterium]|nr:carboxypeptidase-like regulatory domain-containing protein [Candidatus Sumerlaeaceae bacterium]